MTTAKWISLGSLGILSLGALLVGCGGGVKVGEGWPAWTLELPAQRVPGEVGTSVWAGVPRAGDAGARTGLFRIEAIQGRAATLNDALGNRFTDVPGALIHGLAERELVVGELVLVDVDASGPVWGQVTANDEVAYDWNGVTVRAAADSAVPLTWDDETRVLRPWVYTHEGQRHIGLGIAQDEEKLWLLEADGHVRVLAKTETTPMSSPTRTAWQVGQKVQLDSWAEGLQEVEIALVMEEGLSFEVRRLSGAGGTSEPPFSSLWPIP